MDGLREHLEKAGLIVGQFLLSRDMDRKPPAEVGAQLVSSESEERAALIDALPNLSGVEMVILLVSEIEKRSDLPTRATVVHLAGYLQGQLAKQSTHRNKADRLAAERLQRRRVVLLVDKQLAPYTDDVDPTEVTYEAGKIEETFPKIDKVFEDLKKKAAPRSRVVPWLERFGFTEDSVHAEVWVVLGVVTILFAIAAILTAQVLGKPLTTSAEGEGQVAVGDGDPAGPEAELNGSDDSGAAGASGTGSGGPIEGGDTAVFPGQPSPGGGIGVDGGGVDGGGVDGRPVDPGSGGGIGIDGGGGDTSSGGDGTQAQGPALGSGPGFRPQRGASGAIGEAGGLPATCVVSTRMDELVPSSMSCQEGVGRLVADGQLGPWHNDIAEIVMDQGVVGNVLMAGQLGESEELVALEPVIRQSLVSRGSGNGIQQLVFTFNANNQQVSLHQGQDRGGAVLTLTFRIDR